MLVNKQLLIMLAFHLLQKEKKVGRCNTLLLFASEERRIWVRERHHLLWQGIAADVCGAISGKRLEEGRERENPSINKLISAGRSQTKLLFRKALSSWIYYSL